MEIDIIVLIVLGIICCIGLGIVVVVHLRNVAAVEKTNTQQEFTLLAPTLNILLCYVGFVLTVALLITFTATEIAELWIRVLFGIFAFCFGVEVYATSKFNINFNEKTFTKHGIFKAKEFRIDDLVKKHTINMGFAVRVYTKKKRAFSYNQNCIGSEYLSLLLKSLPELETF